MLAPHRPPATISVPVVGAAELWALTRVLDDVVQQRETGCPPHYPLLALRLLEEDLAARAAAAELDEWLAARTATSLRRPRRWACWGPRR